MKQTPSSMRLYATLILIVVTLLMAACAADTELDPTPILPPPATLNETATAINADTGLDDSIESVAEAETAVSDPATTPAADPNITPTPTLEPTPTLLPTATPVTNPPMQPLSLANMPPISRDLVFLADGSLKMWNHNNGQIETLYAGAADPNAPRINQLTQLAGDITQFSVSADSNRIAATRLTHTVTITETVGDANAPVQMTYKEYELLFLDVVSRESWTLAESINNLGDFSISPNQKNVAFSGTSLIANPEPEMADIELPANVYVVGTPDGETRQVGSCPGPCFSISWHPNSDLFTWSDNNALWLFNLSGSSPEPLINNQTDSPANSKFYRTISWAGDGRSVLLWEQAWEGGSRVIFDIPTGIIIPVPDTFTYAEPFPTEVSWMQDDRLLILRSALSATQQTSLEIWRVALEQGQLIQEERYQPDLNAAAAGAIHLENGRFAYALISQSDANISGIHLQTSLSEASERVNGLIPSFIAPQITWSPDGTGAIVIQNGYVLFAPTNGDVLYDGTAVFGTTAHSFEWLSVGTVPR
ncbi:MAG: hypothetical protein GY943_03925 [Chloroflexi bacterium]|nr:hypothetical protein [Chloroflexota bacterium]